MPLSADDRVKYKALYLQTAKPYVQDLQDAITSFQGGQIDPEKLAVAHRAAHSMTSQSRMMEYNNTGHLTSIMEKIFKAKIDGLLDLHPELLQTLAKAVEHLQADIAEIEKSGDEVELATDRDALSTIAKIPVD